MPITFEKTWQYAFNQNMDSSSVAAQQKNSLWAIKAFLKGEYAFTDQTGGAIAAPTGLWTCYGSSDSVTAGLDASDRWTGAFDAAKIVPAVEGIAHSWMVVKSPTALGPFYMIMNYVSVTTIDLVFCKAAPTGGSTTNRPTSTDEWSYSSMAYTSGAVTTHRMHGAVATDGTFFVLGSQNGNARAEMAILGMALKDARAVDGYNFVTYAGYVYAAGGALITASTTSGVANQGGTAASWKGRAASGAGPVVLAGLAPAYYSAGALSASAHLDVDADATDAKYNSLPIYIQTYTVGQKSVRGRLPFPDFAWASDAIAQGSVSGAVDSACGGHIWIPANVAPSF